VAAPLVKLQRWWSGIGDDYGRPGIVVMITALAGVVLTIRLGWRRPIALVFLAWLAAWLALSALGILTALTLRANLAAAPAFVFFCGVALGAAANRSFGWRLAAIALGVLIAWDGFAVAVNATALAQ